MPRRLASASALLLAACTAREAPPAADAWRPLPPIPPADTLATPAAGALVPEVVTAPVLEDSDDPAIWIDPADPARSLVIGTDKGDTNGGLYVFRLDGSLDTARTRHPLRRPNNVASTTGLPLGGRSIDIAVTTERGARRLRVFTLPDMRAVDGGGIPVFDGDTARAPMGVALYRRPSDGAIFAIVGGKSGPAEGYLWQYRLADDGTGTVRGTKVRAFGAYGAQKEIEAIAVDDRLGYVYYSDETVGVRKYHADPDRPEAGAELALFADTGVVQDHEGLAIYATGDSTGYLVLSDQQGRRIQVFPREGSARDPHAHSPLAVIPVSAMETDGLEVTNVPLGPRFPQGMLVMMSTNRTFHFYDWRDVAARLPRR
ncbi:MAG: phytase [Gemmatimonadales bacterium]|nr:phytase [Gemmatimonadales bacterium]